MSADLKFSDLVDEEFKDIRTTLASIRNPPKGTHMSTLACYERDELAVKAIWNHSCDRGDILHDDLQGYIFERATKRLIGIDGSPECANLLINYGLYPRDPLCSKMRDTMGIWALERGRKVALRSVAHYDTASRRQYLHLGNGRVCRISANEISQVDNGTDGVLFKGAGQRPFNVDFNNLPICQYGLKVTPDSLVCQVFNGNWQGNSVDQHQLYLCKLFSLLFPGMFGANSIALNSGEHRSGKTSAAAKIGWLLIGDGFSVTALNRDIKDVETAFTNEFLVVLDNVDSSKTLCAMEDLMAIAATGGSIKRRRLYTDNSVVTCPIVSQIYLTSRGNPIVRNDLVDRTLTFKFAKFDQPGGPQAQSEKDIQQSVLAVRGDLMAEVIVRCQKILQALEAEKEQTYSSSFRIKDFSRFCLAIAHAEGWHQPMADIFARITEEQSETSLAGNPVYEVLRLWIGTNSRNLTNPISASALDRGLAEIADSAKIHYPARGKAPFLSRLLQQSQTEFKEAIGMQIVPDKKGKRSLFSFHPTDQIRTQCIEEARASLADYARLVFRAQPTATDDGIWGKRQSPGTSCRRGRSVRRDETRHKTAMKTAG